MFFIEKAVCVSGSLFLVYSWEKWVFKVVWVGGFDVWFWD